MTNTNEFNATAADIMLALADLASPQTDDTIDDLATDFCTALDQLDCDDQLRDALHRAFDAIMLQTHPHRTA